MSQSDPHDSYFRAVMQYMIAAQQFLSWQAPEYITDNIDLNSLTLVDTTYIDNSLGKTFSDVVFDCKYKAQSKSQWQESEQENEQDAKIVILIEHQSSAEKLLPIRVYNYIFNLLEKLRKTRDKKDSNKPLPVVYPMVFYNGTHQHYPYSTSLHACIAGPQQAMAFYPSKEIQVVDVNSIPTKETKAHHLAGIMAEAMKRTDKNQTTKNYLAVLKQLAKLASELPTGFTTKTIKYMMKVKQVNNLEQLVEQAEHNQQLSNTVRGEVMTIAEAYIAKGITEGKIEGKIEGKLEGKIEGKIEGKEEVALNMLREGVSITDVAKFTGFEIAKVTELSKQLLN